MAFDAEGNYAPPDQATRHVLVMTEATTAPIPAGYKVPMPQGLVLAAFSMGATNAAQDGVRHINRDGKQVSALMEHETAKVGDVIPAAEVSAGVAATAAKIAAVQKFWAAEKAKEKAPSPAAEPPAAA